ncbi:uncharacterized protein LOC130669684 [Microplitis mediator]|uniref:uncharacterized protein LOC130669684 n=1 Tax=Microplitis mediator TaxID=375433 RepID=UPI0025529459|nr:uncharacterized protein LOC130669684 [Microplitis mediator]XP_057328696.1 uncharacterized protein LOC130669684 [Microplitis mediator]
MATAICTINPIKISWVIKRINRLLDPIKDVNNHVSTRCPVGSRSKKITWEFELMFNQSSSRLSDWISFSLRIVDANKTVSAKFKISIVNNNGVSVLMDNVDGEVLELENKDIYTIDRFIRKEDLFANFDEYAPNDILTIVVEINVLQSVINNVFLPKRERIERKEDGEALPDYSTLNNKPYIVHKIDSDDNEV